MQLPIASSELITVACKVCRPILSEAERGPLRQRVKLLSKLADDYQDFLNLYQ